MPVVPLPPLAHSHLSFMCKWVWLSTAEVSIWVRDPPHPCRTTQKWSARKHLSGSTHVNTTGTRVAAEAQQSRIFGWFGGDFVPPTHRHTHAHTVTVCPIRQNFSGSSRLPSIPFECSGVERRHGDTAALTFRGEEEENKWHKMRTYPELIQKGWKLDRGWMPMSSFLKNQS